MMQSLENIFLPPFQIMAGGKRPLTVKAKVTRESAIEDKEMAIGNLEMMDSDSDDSDTSDSSVYSELEGN
jgi:hypothetical protein